MITTFVRDTSGLEIANILYNNMFPVIDGVCSPLVIDTEIDTYELNEIRYIRKHANQIIQKARSVYRLRKQNQHTFLNRTCCDFEKLEQAYKLYQ